MNCLKLHSRQIKLPIERTRTITHIPLTNAHRADEDATTTAKLMIKAFEKFENLPLDTQNNFTICKDLKYDLYNILFEMVRNNQSKPLDEKLVEFEQIIYRKQVDLKGPVTFRRFTQDALH